MKHYDRRREIQLYYAAFIFLRVLIHLYTLLSLDARIIHLLHTQYYIYIISTLPLRLLMPKTDPLYQIMCIHCYHGSMPYLQFLLSIQVILAGMLIVGYKTKVASIGSWILYLSLTLRNTWLNFILDR